MRYPALMLFGAVGLASTACVPDIYLIDRQTVLELEASGQWPELDQKYRAMALRSGPAPIETTRDTVENRQIFSMTRDDKAEKK